MASPKDVVWAIEPHTRAKHEILKRYLQAWFPIMAQRNGRIIMLDGFAGPGEYIDGSIGSPLIALQTLLNHEVALSYGSEVVFYFIEVDTARYKHLEQLLQHAYPDGTLPSVITWHIVNDRFDEHLSILLDDLDGARSRIAPTFAFIDPFGYSHTPMSVISRLMDHPMCEVLVNVMYEEANRFLSWENTANDSHLDRLFGSHDWRGIRESSLPPEERERRIHDLYARQLEQVGGATYVRGFRMRNKSNRTDYYLFFGTKSLVGLDKMKHAMWKIDPSGAYDFSDTTNPNQAVLFTPEPDAIILRREIITMFTGQTATVRQVEDFVIAKTAFHSGHYKHILKSMEREGRLIAVLPPAKRKSGTYPDKSMLLRFS